MNTARFLGCALFLGHALGFNVASANGLEQAYASALLKDTTFRAARAELLSAQQNLQLAQAGLLPNLSLNLSDAKVSASREIDNTLSQPASNTFGYRTTSQSLNLRMPIFNLEASRKVSLAKAQVNYAEAIFSTRRADLLYRVSNAWSQLFLAEQAIKSAQAQFDFTQHQADSARRRLQLGEGTKLEVVEIEATLGIANVLLFETYDKLAFAKLNFQQLSDLTIEFRPGALSDSNLTRLLEKEVLPTDQLLINFVNNAAEGNRNIAVRKDAVSVARAAVALSSAGHFPRLDLLANFLRNRNETLNTLNQSSRQQYFGLQLNLPLYSGGAVNALVVQALANQEKAEAELVAEQQSVTLDATRFNSAVNRGRSKVGALKIAVEAAELSLESARRSMQTGFGLQADLAEAQRKLARARFDLSQSIVDLLLAKLRLAELMGNDPLNSINLLDSFLQSTIK